MIAVAIARYLDSQGIVSFDETGTTGNCFIGHMPSTPDEAVMLKSTGGDPVDIKFSYDEPRLQTLVRGTTDPTSGEAKAQEIYDALHGLGAVLLDPGGSEEVWLVRCMAVDTPEIGRAHV